MKNSKSKKILFTLTIILVLFIILIYIYPFIKTVVNSFYSINLNNSTYVGFSNYIELFKNEAFGKAIVNSILFSIVTTITIVFLASFYMYLINYKIKSLKIKNFLIIIIVIPSIISIISVSSIFANMFNYKYGFINNVLQSFNISKVFWLTSNKVTPLVIIIIYIWRNVGYTLLIFITAYKTIPQNIIKAAFLETNKSIKIYLKIVIPYIFNYFLISVIINIIDATKQYDLIYMLIGYKKAQFIGYETMLSSFYKYFYVYNDKGMSSAVIVITTLIILLILLFCVLILKRRKKYETKK